MAPNILDPPMPRTHKPPRDDKAVKIERGLAMKAAVIAETLGYASMAEYLSELVRAPIERDWPKALKKIDRKEPVGD